MEALKKSDMLKDVSGTSSSFVAFVWDQPCAGESMTAPHLRMAPFKLHMLNAYATGCLQARSGNSEDLSIQKGDMFLFADGGLRGLQNRFTRALVDKPEKAANKDAVKKRKIVTIGYEQDSLQERRGTIRGYVPQLENFVVVARGDDMASMPLRKRRRFAEASKTNKGTLLAPVRVPTYEEIWTLKWEVKRQALGSHRMAVGGVTEKADPDEGEDDDIDEDELPPTLQEVTDKKAKKRKSRFEGEEPVYYQSLKSPQLWEEAINSFCIGHIVLFTAGDGACIEACLETDTSLVAFTSSPLHATLLQDRTVRYMLKNLRTPNPKNTKLSTLR